MTDRKSPPAESDPAAPAAGSDADGSPPGGSSPAGSSARHSPEGSQTCQVLPRSIRHRAGPFGIGITGPIGCGKSTVAAWLGELGAAVIDADLVAQRRDRAWRSGGSPRSRRCSGRTVVRDDGALDRAALGQIVFADPVALASLESIVHPAVRPVILRAYGSRRAGRRPGRDRRGDQARRGWARRRSATRSGSSPAPPRPSWGAPRRSSRARAAAGPRGSASANRRRNPHLVQAADSPPSPAACWIFSGSRDVGSTELT